MLGFPGAERIAMWLFRMPAFMAGSVLPLALHVVLFTEVLHAQSTNASLAGRVTDPSKALVVGAKVSLISADTNVRYEDATNGAGEFILANLLPGAYRIEIEKSGFKIHNILGNWSLDSFVIIRSAPPVDVVGAQISAGVAVFMPRPDIKPGLPQVLYASKYPGGKAFNPAAFVPAPSGQQGDLGRNVLRGFRARKLIWDSRDSFT